MAGVVLGRREAGKGGLGYVIGPNRSVGSPGMVILALDWYIWAALGLLFAYALGRRLWRSWRLKRRSRARRAAGYGSKRP